MGRRATARVMVAGLALLAAACGSGSTEQVGAPPSIELPAESVAPSSAPTTARPTTTAELVKPASVTLPVPSTAPATTAAPPTTAPPETTPPPTAAPAPAPGAAAPRAPVAPPPAGVREDASLMGTIEIPKLGLTTGLYEGIAMSTLDKGPGYWPGTAPPGEAGNTVIAGHRTSKSKPFRYIDRLVEGDEIVLSTAAGRFVYVVTGHEIVTPDAVWILDQNTPAPQVTLFACHPPGSVAYRWVTRATLVG